MSSQNVGAKQLTAGRRFAYRVHHKLSYVPLVNTSSGGGDLAKSRQVPKRDPAFAERFREAMEESGWKAGKLAKAEGVVPGTASKWLRGEMPDDLRLPRLAERFGVQLKWLKSGEEPRYAPRVISEPLNRAASISAVAELDRAVSELDRARATLAQLRAALGVRSGPDESAWIGVARASGAGSDSPPQGAAPPGSETG